MVISGWGSGVEMRFETTLDEKLKKNQKQSESPITNDV